VNTEKQTRFLFVLGGARSGKSSWAQRWARERAGDAVLYIATALPHDDEMAQRIARHRQDRAPFGWYTCEVVSGSLAENLSAAWDPKFHVILLDCATLWLSRLLCEMEGSLPDETLEFRIMKEADAFLSAWRMTDADLVVVSNEVGWSVVPDHRLGRLFRDIQGRFNQRMAGVADEVVLLVAGLPLWVKPPRGKE